MTNEERALRFLIQVVESHRLRGGGPDADRRLYASLRVIREFLAEPSS